jgi:beta-glucosidase
LEQIGVLPDSQSQQRSAHVAVEEVVVKAYRGTLPAVVALVLLGTACSGTDTNTVTNEIPACSSSYPTGTCSSGQACFQGACVASTSLCSPSNLSGTCAPGLTCYGGGCVLPSAVPPVTPTLDCTKPVYTAQPVLKFATAVPTDSTGAPLGTAKLEIVADNLHFRDLSGDGTLQKYEDWRYSPICRAMDLVTRMTVAQKVGLMSEGGGLGNGTTDGSIPAAVQSFIMTSHGRQGLIRFSVTAPQLAVYVNKIEALAEVQPLGIPIVITADPSHATGLSMSVTGVQTLSQPSLFTPWPGTLGLAAIRDDDLTQAHGDNVRREWMAMGLRWQLGPQVDVTTEPRWSRVSGTFGPNALAAARHTAAMVRGFQNSSTGDLRTGIAATLKHFAGYGAQENGADGHSFYGRYTVFPNDNFAYHLISFQAGIDMGAAAIMPSYTIAKAQYDVDPLQVPSAFSYELLTKTAREAMGFTGMFTDDWCTFGSCRSIGANGYNMELLTDAERIALWLSAGSNQLGNEPASMIQDSYDQHLITDAQIDAAATKILEMTFKLGLFENPYVDDTASVVNAAMRTVDDRTLAFQAQKRAIVLLKNADHASSAIRYLPINGSRLTGTAHTCDTNGDGVVTVYYDGVVDSIVADPLRPDAVTDIFGDYNYTSAAAGNTLGVAATNTLANADIAVVRIAARGGSQAYGAPLSFDGVLTPEELNWGTDSTLASAAASKKKVIDLFRARDGYKLSDGTPVVATNPTLQIVLVMNQTRPGIVRPFINGLVSLDEQAGVPGSYPTVSNEANIRSAGGGGVDAFLVEFGAFDRALLDVLFNVNAPVGVTYGSARLPMQIPANDDQVKAQSEDLPEDILYPTYQAGEGILMPAN